MSQDEISAVSCCDVQVQVEVDKDSKEAKKAAQKSAAASTGLDAFLQQIESKKKVSIQCLAPVALSVVSALSMAFIPLLVLSLGCKRMLLWWCPLGWKPLVNNAGVVQNGPTAYTNID